ncbi:MAG TPA: hypothetical protein VF783_16980 [Terriglobales bacterium]
MSFTQNLIRRFEIWFRKPPKPQDPYAKVTANLKRGPGGRSAAVALEEPAPASRLNLFGERSGH